MNTWVNFYQDVMGFRNLISFDDKDISTEYSSLMSKVVASGNDRIKFPINEPAQGRKKSQIDEYLDFYRGPGVQHLAIATDNIIETVTALRDRGVDFLQVPKAYYDSVLDRVGQIDEDLAPLKELGILVDRDDEGLSAADLQQAGAGPADAVLRDHSAEGRQELRQGELQGAVRGDRAGAGGAEICRGSERKR